MNDFAHLDAQDPMSALAKVASHERADVDTRPECSILPFDIGDEDCVKLIYEVWSDNAIVHTAGTQQAACQWATDNGYKLS